MLELREVLNLSKEVVKYVNTRRLQLGLSGESLITPRLLQQERDTTVIYTWDDVTPNKKNGPVVTHVGIYEPSIQSHKVLWVNDSQVYLTTCSVNAEKTLLAFTTKDIYHSSSSQKQTKDIYKAFLAEVQPSKRVFALNIERQLWLKVQFLYGVSHEAERMAHMLVFLHKEYVYKAFLMEVQPSKRVFALNIERQLWLKVLFLYGVTHEAERMAHMLVFLHKKSIGLYSIPLARVDKGVIMSGQPQTEQLTKHFTWCQWDAIHQRLHYLHHRKATNVRTSTTNQAPSTQTPVLSCIQFTQRAKYQCMLDVPVSQPFPFVKSSRKQMYHDLPLHTGIPDPTVNVNVLTSANGTVCICHQHPMKLPVASRDSSPQIAAAQKIDIEYTITMPHHGKTLSGSGRVDRESVSESTRLLFFWMNDYVAVCLPGQFVHLLNVSVEFEPCHHILLHANSWEHLPVHGHQMFEHQASTSRAHEADPAVGADSTVAAALSLLDPSTSHMQHVTIFYKEPIHVSSGVLLFDCDTCKAYRLVISTPVLVDVFTTCYMPTLRQAIMHYASKGPRDMALIKKLFEVLSNDIASPEVPSLMAEFLICSVYVSMRRQVGKEVFHLLPFSTVETFRGQLEKDDNRDRLARVTYLPIKLLNVGTKTSKDCTASLWGHADDIWINLFAHLQLRRGDVPLRFKQDLVYKEWKDFLRAKEQKNSVLPVGPTQRQPSFLSKTPTRTERFVHDTSTNQICLYGSTYRRSDSALGQAPAFLLEGEKAEHQEMLFTITEQLFSKHLSKTLKKDSKVKVMNVAREYSACQLQASRQLCHLLWSLRKTGFEEFIILTQRCTKDEYELFQLLERYYLTLLELAFPMPNGFMTFFTSLGYRCLDFRMFLQYVDRGVLHLTGVFMSQILSDLPDEDEECVQIKMQLISRLSRACAEECFQQWDHPLALRHSAIQQVSNLLKDVSNIDRSIASRAQHSRNQRNRLRVYETDIGENHPVISLLDMIHGIAEADEFSHQHSDGHLGVSNNALKDAAMQNMPTGIGGFNL